IAAGFVYVLLPDPVPVDVGRADRGPMLVSVDEEGETRIKEIYTVSAPVAGRLLRLPVHVGDSVVKGATTVASLLPVSPSFLDQRTRSQLSAAAAAAEAAVGLAEAERARMQAEVRFAQSSLERARKLAKSATISQTALEKAVLDYDTAQAALKQAEANLELRRHELESAQARLIEPDALPEYDQQSCCIVLDAPADGRVLKTIQESEAVIAAGTPIVEIGDPANLEIIVDLLSSDAVRIETGAAARIEAWGGPPLKAKVRRIDPAGFTKVSALGIEEQRVTTVLDLLDPPEQWRALGHDFGVFVRIEEWSDDAALRVPLSALFRAGGDWAVFRLAEGKAELTIVELGHRNDEYAEVLGGLDEGAPIILYPSDQVSDGAAVIDRNAER
ncbi:MAG TPA: HlyD family efflux transporter periplasmic adaptor subunit, partial [Afifellaceae bacterium]|nr:HlyD family efflux transporter periplasmic adaptor subunit [Afifellaceae bacterium]